MQHLKSYFEQKPVVAAVRDTNSLSTALNSDVIALFVLDGNILDLSSIMTKVRENDKLLFLHLDLIDGIAQDKAGVEYLAQKNLCDGIITTRRNLIGIAKKNDLMAIQRLFLLDSASLKSGQKLLKKSQPDAVEILPGIAAPYFLEHVSDESSCPVIAGGLVREKEQVVEIVDKGVMAVSTSNQELWKSD